MFVDLFEFRELSEVILAEKVNTIPNWKEFILNFCLDIGDSFKTWTAQNLHLQLHHKKI